MAVDSTTTEVQENVSSASVLTETPIKPSANAETKATATNIVNKTEDMEFRHNTEVNKDEILARRASELLNHFYSRYHNQHTIPITNNEISDDSCSENEFFDDDFIDSEYELLKPFTHKKTNNYCRAKQMRTPFKERKFVEFCRDNYEAPDNIALEKGTKKSVRIKFSRCSKEMSKNRNRKDHSERRKVNIEKKLKKLGLKRRQEDVTRPGTTNDHLGKPEKFELNETNAPNDIEDMLAFLMSLQDREVTPEDYELLLKLDDLIPKKTVSEKRLKKLTGDVTDGSHVEDVCSVCMEVYMAGQIRKILPCKHAFHSNCIEQWLRQFTTCPLDGLEV